MEPKDYSMFSVAKLKNIIEQCSKNNSDYEDLMQDLLNDNRSSVQKLGQDYFNKKEKMSQEVKRVTSLYEFDKSFHTPGLIAGVDEVGRGPLAGPIVAAAVVLDISTVDENSIILNINDSKKVSPKERERLSAIIKEKAVAYNIKLVENTIIDAKGISFANNEVLKVACEELKCTPNLVISDGFPIKGITIPNKFIIKGDSKSASIACASIIAKVYRDNLMKKYAELYPHYGFDKNAGYGTKEHIEAIKKYGICPIHRKSFITNII